MPYSRIDCAEVKNELAAMTASLKAAKDYAAAKDVFLRKDKLERHVSTLYNLAYVRHSINTKDEFYDGEIKFWNAALPEIEEFIARLILISQEYTGWFPDGELKYKDWIVNTDRTSRPQKDWLAFVIL